MGLEDVINIQIVHQVDPLRSDVYWQSHCGTCRKDILVAESVRLMMEHRAGMRSFCNEFCMGEYMRPTYEYTIGIRHVTGTVPVDIA